MGIQGILKESSSWLTHRVEAVSKKTMARAESLTQRASSLNADTMMISAQAKLHRHMQQAHPERYAIGSERALWQAAEKRGLGAQTLDDVIQRAKDVRGPASPEFNNYRSGLMQRSLEIKVGERKEWSVVALRQPDRPMPFDRFYNEALLFDGVKLTNSATGATRVIQGAGKGFEQWLDALEKGF